MNLSSILTLLQLVLALLSNPTTAQNPQVQALAAQAINEATLVLSSQASSTDTLSSTISLSIPTSTDNAQPIVINVTNPPQAPVSNNQNLGATQPEVVQSSTPVGPMQIPWVGVNGMTQGLQFGFNGIDTPQGITQTSTIFTLHSETKFWDSGTLTINGQTYNLPITHNNSKPNLNSNIEFGVQGLQSGQDYQYTVQINSGNLFASNSDGTNSDIVSIP